MKYRSFGGTGPETSAVALGTMRLDAERLGRDGARDLLLHLADRGLTTFHSSREYDTHEFFASVLREVRRLRPGWTPIHVAKIGVPHFDESEFDPAKLEKIVDEQRGVLGTDTIHFVQWLVRSTPNTDERRLPILDRCAHALEDVWGRMQDRGSVDTLVSYPYSVPFMERVLDLPMVRGLATYLNLLEREPVPYLDRMYDDRRGLLAIRPLAAGRLGEGAASSDPDAFADLREAIGGRSPAAAAVRFPLLHPATASVLVSLSSRAHADEILDAVEDLDADPTRFRSVTRQLSEREPSLARG